MYSKIYSNIRILLIDIDIGYYLDVEVNAENIQKILKAANVKVETYWPGLFETLVKDKGVAALITGGMDI